MKDSDKFCWSAIVVFVIWALGWLWHPFGLATWLWHVILWAIIIIMIWRYYYCFNKEKENED